MRNRALEMSIGGVKDDSGLMRRLDPRQRRVLDHFMQSDTITSRDVAELFSLSQRTARHLLSGWTDDGFLTIIDPAKKCRKYGLNGEFRILP